MRITIDDQERPQSEVAVRTVTRGLLGLVVAAQGLSLLAQRGGAGALLDEGAWQAGSGGELSLAMLAVLCGACLMLGLFTRVSGVLAAFLAGAVLMQLGGQFGHADLAGWPTGLSGLLFQIVLGVGFMVTGGQRGSLDHLLAERSRLKAIQQDNLWLQPPYVRAGRVG